MGDMPTFDAAELAVRGWLNRRGFIPPSGQGELADCIDRLLGQKDSEIDRLRTERDKLREALSHEVVRAVYGHSFMYLECRLCGGRGKPKVYAREDIQHADGCLLNPTQENTEESNGQ